MKNIRVFLSENFQFLEVKFSIHLNRCVFVMQDTFCHVHGFCECTAHTVIRLHRFAGLSRPSLFVYALNSFYSVNSSVATDDQL